MWFSIAVLASLVATGSPSKTRSTISGDSQARWIRLLGDPLADRNLRHGLRFSGRELLEPERGTRDRLCHGGVLYSGILILENQLARSAAGRGRNNRPGQTGLKARHNRCSAPAP